MKTPREKAIEERAAIFGDDVPRLSQPIVATDLRGFAAGYDAAERHYRAEMKRQRRQILGRNESWFARYKVLERKYNNLREIVAEGLQLRKEGS